MTTNPTTDELDELTLRRAQVGEPEACRALVTCYQQRVFALVGRMLGAGRASEVEDLAQETFLDVFRALGRFSALGPARLSTWILTIASRRSIDFVRTARPVSAGVEVDACGDPGADPERGLRRRRVRDAIEAAVSDLAPEYRAAFLLREFHGLTYDDIATALAIDVGTVKSRLSRARKALREALAEVRHG